MGYIIIRGPLGVGKTTVATELAQMLGAEYISIDEVLEENGLDVVDEELGYISPDNFIAANELVIPHIQEQLDAERIVIIDGNFYHMEQIDHFRMNLDAQHKVFTLNAPVEVCIKRDSKRKPPHGEGAARAVHALVAEVNAGITINVDHKKVHEVIEAIVQRLV